MTNEAKRRYALTGHSSVRKSFSQSLADANEAAYRKLIGQNAPEQQITNYIKNNKLQVMQDIEDLRDKVLKVLNASLENPDTALGTAKHLSKFLFPVKTEPAAPKLTFTIDSYEPRHIQNLVDPVDKPLTIPQEFKLSTDAVD